MRNVVNAESRRVLTGILAVLFFLAASPLSAAVTVTGVQGKVFLKNSGAPVWSGVSIGRTVGSGDEIVTRDGARVTLTFDDGSRIEIGPKSTFTLEAAAKDESRSRIGIGWMKAFVTKSLNRRFAVKTPTAVCSVRGTEFDVNVQRDGNTAVNLFKGQLGVADSKGNELMLNEGQSVSVTQQGLGQPTTLGSQSQSSQSDSRAALKREVGLDMSKEEVQAAAAAEQKNAVYQEGKTMVDVNGNRVRLEEYIIRPAPDKYKFVVLNERQDRFDYFYRLGTFNKALPDDLSAALRQLPGCVGAPCEWWLKSFETGYSNTQDKVLETAWDGHLVDVNNNLVAGDEVRTVFDPNVNDYVIIAQPNVDSAVGNPGRTNPSFYTTLFDNYTLAYNGVNHNVWTPDLTKTAGGIAYNALLAGAGDGTAVGAGNCNAAGVGPGCGGVQTEGGTAAGTDHRTVVNTTSLLYPQTCDGNVDACVIPRDIQRAIDEGKATRCESLDNCTGFREAGKYHKIFFSKNAGGDIWDKYDTYVISDEGKVGDDASFGPYTSASTFKSNLLKWNYQQVITASEFQGRKIDLVFEPKILIQSGIIP
jgi:hypothetical protein